MVNQLSSLEKLVRFAEENNLVRMKKWSLRYRSKPSNEKSWYINKLKKKIRQLLDLVSGGDIFEMLDGSLLNYVFFLFIF